MKAGDIVRFHTGPYADHLQWPPMGGEASTVWKVGLLVEYQSWEKIARILYDGEVLSVRAENTQLAISHGPLKNEPRDE